MALVRERVHPATMAAEGPLHELGAIGIVNSDSQGMGRIDGDGPADDPARPRDEGLARDRRRAGSSRAAARAGRPVRRDRAGPALPGQGDDRAGDRARRRPATSGRWRRAASPTSCCGSRPTSGSSPSSCSRPASAPGRRSARATRRSSAPSRPAIGPTGAGPAGRPPSAVADVRVRARRRRDRRPRRRGSRPAAGPSSPVGGTRGLTRADLVRNRATAPIEIDPGDGRVTLAGRPLEVEPGRRRCRSTAGTGSADRRPRAASSSGLRPRSSPDVADREAVGERVGRVDDVARRSR